MPKTLLLADDSVTIQKVVGITFANEDVELVTVDNGTDALARARDLKPDIILADIAMPGLGGYELCAAIRRDPQLAQTPVLLLTGTFETYDEAKGQAVGASGHIAKPFEARALIGQFYALVGQPAPAQADPQQPAVAAPPQAQPAPPQAAPVAPPVQAQPVQAPPIQAQPIQAPPVQAQPIEAPPIQAQPIGAQPIQAQPVETQPMQAPMAAPDTPVPQPAPPPPPVVPFEPAQPAAQAATATEQPVAPAPAMPEIESDGPSTMSDLPNTDFGNTVPPVMPSASPLIADPDLVGPPPLVASPAAAPPADDFSFDDLDFNTPDTNTDTGIFGEDSQSGVAAAPANADAYGETAFLDPQAARRALAQGPSAPHEPDPMADTIPEDPFADTSTLPRPLIDRLNTDAPSIQPPAAPTPAPVVAEPAAPIPEAVPWSDPEPVAPPTPAPVVPAAPAPVIPAAPAPVAQAAPVAPAPLAEPMDLQPLEDHDTEPLDLPALEAEPLPEDEAATVFAPEAFAEATARHGRTPTTVEAEPTAALFATQTEPTADLFAPEPLPEIAAAEEPPFTVAEPLPDNSSVHLDPTLVRESIEKVAWEAFGTLQDQLVRDVMSKAEAIVWEVVPQVTERLIREEIARIKADTND